MPPLPLVLGPWSTLAQLAPAARAETNAVISRGQPAAADRREDEDDDESGEPDSG